MFSLLTINSKKNQACCKADSRTLPLQTTHCKASSSWKSYPEANPKLLSKSYLLMTQTKSQCNYKWRYNENKQNKACEPFNDAVRTPINETAVYTCKTVACWTAEKITCYLAVKCNFKRTGGKQPPKLYLQTETRPKNHSYKYALICALNTYSNICKYIHELCWYNLGNTFKNLNFDKSH